MILEFDSIEKNFGNRVLLSSIYMRCQTGKIIGLLGRNGSGKTTLMRIVFGIESATHKSIRVNCEPLTGNYLSKGVISYLPQGNLFLPHRPLEEAFRLSAIPTRAVMEFFPEVADLLGKKPEQLSFGTRRILACALVLLSNHPFCFLDEPFSGLAPVQIERIVEVLGRLKQKKGILLSDHLHRYVQALADEMYVLANGTTYPVRGRDDLIRFGYLPDTGH